MRALLRTTLAGLVVLLIAVIAGCGSDSPAPDEHTGHDDHTSAPGPGTTEAHDVTVQWLSTIYSWQPVTDDSPTDALIRGRTLAVGTLAEANPPRVRSNRPLWPQWPAWRSSKDIISAAVGDVDVVALTPTTAEARTEVTQTVLHPDGSSTPLQKLDVSVSLIRQDSGQWRVSDYRQTPR